jgi:tetratricopeptide (TPR) repeat protein
VAETGDVEGLLDSGGESREPETKLGGADAVAMAVALEQARHDPELSRKVGAYVDEQRQLVRLQVKHFEEERYLSISAAKRKRYTDRIRNALFTLVAVVAGAVVVAVGALIWDARHDAGMVVEAFSVPPDLESRGLSGQVLARQLLDRLSAMQSDTVSARPARSYRNNWGDDIKVEIPETGVSLGELRRVLRNWLGHETQISGEVFRSAAGLTVTARAGEEAAQSISGADTELETLVQRAAETVYERTQPYRYAKLLNNEQRYPEALAVLEKLKQNADPLERAWAHYQFGFLLATTRGDYAADVSEQQAALREVPDFAPAFQQQAAAESRLGHDQAAVDDAVKYLAANRAIQRYIAPDAQPIYRALVLANKAEKDGDYAESFRQVRTLPTPSISVYRNNDIGSLARVLVLDHDLAQADAMADQLDAEQPSRLLVHGLTALERGDRNAASLIEQSATLAQIPGQANLLAPRSITPMLAIARARLGDQLKARELVATTPADCYLCVRSRGIIAAEAGDRAEADRWFAEAINQGLLLPQAYVDRGIAHLAWGDLAGALADAEHATRLSPHHADAWKLWGDALARQNRWKLAIDKYDEALKFASNWQQLKEAREAAAKQKT